MRTLYQWLEQDEHSIKHTQWLHPTVSVVLHFLTVFVVAFAAHDWLLLLYKDDGTAPSNCTDESAQHVTLASFFFVYAAWLLFWRLWLFREPCILYEYCWLCNVTLCLSPAALLLKKPIIAQACCVTVGIDQLLWYADLAAYAVTGKFPIGVAKYLTNHPWISRITATHHLWTIPLLLSATRALHSMSLPLSAILMTTNVLVSRFLTPHVVPGRNGNRILNVNLAHALWKDIDFSILQINYDDPPVFLYLFRLLWRWQGFNTLVFLFLHVVSGSIWGPARIC